ncbi:sensor histidine kinase [Fervidibacillus halotolerans]|uniref:histidine kinase n=1 Tax=Fervidibacillus halotolerans TaxID=2980027 RepID=A0A9E8M298_9BACI|nr:sensor histidine kinase [Fervidibacillus halotolerans]WAA13956.1 sensor histidine kinase [Fervidibacillus halotolerans]
MVQSMDQNKRSFELFPKEFGFFPYVFLSYLLFPIISISFTAGIKKMIGYFLLVIFFISYRRLFFLPSGKQFTFWVAIQMIIVYIFTFSYHHFLFLLGFYPGNFIGWYKGDRQFKRAVVAYFAFNFLLVIYFSLQYPMEKTLYYVPNIIAMMLSPFAVRSFFKRIELEKQLAKANQRIEELVKREERVRIARDLHDTLGHTLSLITLKSQLLQKMINKNLDRVKQEASDIENISRTALREARKMISDMRSMKISEALLSIEQMFQHAGVKCIVEGETYINNLSMFTQNLISMCLKEAAINIVKHSNASICRIVIQKKDGFFSINIRDDGIGFNESVQEGNGLKGIRERLSLINGTARFENVNGGALVQLKIPIIMKEYRGE